MFLFYKIDVRIISSRRTHSYCYGRDVACLSVCLSVGDIIEHSTVSTWSTSMSYTPLQRPLMDRKTNFRLVVYSHSSTNPANGKDRSWTF